MTRQLTDALGSIPGFDRLQEAAALSRAVEAALLAIGHPSLAGQVFSAHRSDPSRGIRGSRLVVVARHQAAIAKLTLVGEPLLAQLSLQGLGFQSIAVRAPVAITQTLLPPPPPRPPVPEAARARLRAQLADASELAGSAGQAQDH